MGHTRRIARTGPLRPAVIASVAASLAIAGIGSAALAEQAGAAAKLYRADRFQPEHSGTGWAAWGLGSRSCTSSPFAEGGAGVTANVDLPDGARIARVTFYYLDNDADDDLGFGLAGSFIDGQGGLHLNDEIAPGAQSSGASPANRTAVVSPPTPYEVDNAAEDLSLGVGFEACGEEEGGPFLGLHGARIDYVPADGAPPDFTRRIALGARRGFAFALRSDEPALVAATLFDALGRSRTLSFVARPGFNVRRVPIDLAPGGYFIALRARDAAGNTTPGAFLLRFVVR